MKKTCIFWVLVVLSIAMLWDKCNAGVELLVADASGDFLESTVKRFDGYTSAELGTLIDGGETLDPRAIAYGPDGDLYIANLNGTVGSRGVYQYNGRTGVLVRQVFEHTGVDLFKMTFGPDGGLYVVDRHNYVTRYDVSTGDSKTFASGGGLNTAWDLAFGPDKNLYVVSMQTSDIICYNGSTGDYMYSISTVPYVGTPVHIAFGLTGELYMTGGQNNVARISGALPRIGFNAFGIDEINDIEIGPDGDIYLVDKLPDGVFRYDGTTGEYVHNVCKGWINDMTFTPEPATLLLLGLGALMLRRNPQTRESVQNKTHGARYQGQ